MPNATHSIWTGIASIDALIAPLDPASLIVVMSEKPSWREEFIAQLASALKGSVTELHIVGLSDPDIEKRQRKLYNVLDVALTNSGFVIVSCEDFDNRDGIADAILRIDRLGNVTRTV